MIGAPSITRFVKFIRLGEAAVRYYLTSSAKSIAVDADGNAVSPDETISIRVMKQVGSSSPVKNYDCSFICYTVKDGVETNFGPSKFSGSFSFSAEMINGEDAIRAKLFSTAGDVIDTLDIIASKKGDKGDKGDQGDKGDKGDKGVDAVVITITPDNIVHKKSSSAAKYDIKVTVKDGQTNVANGENGFRVTPGYSFAKGITTSTAISADGTEWHFYINVPANAEANSIVDLVIVYNGAKTVRYVKVSTVSDGSQGPQGDKGDKGDTGEKGDKGDRGAVLRGPQAWADIANGYVFQAGGDNDEWKDVVLYNGNYYSCLKGHTKTASNYPTSTEDTNNGYWKLGDKIELVATKILLATYALVKNLGVEAIDMKDSSGDVIFQAKDGKVICNSGTFENVTIAGYMYKKKTIITKNNVSEYTTTDIFSDPCLDILKSGTWVEFSDLSQNLFILMPSIYPDITTYTEEQKRVVRSMIGNTILLQNTSSKIVGITGRLKSAENKSGESVGINQNEFISLECKATVTNDYEDIYWLYRKGKIR